MKIENLKELQKLIKLCRAEGVESIRVDGIEMHLGAKPEASASKRINTNVFPEAATLVSPGGITESTKILTDELTPEQLLYYSARPESYEDNQQ